MVWALAGAAFLVAAKAHGRQLRLERELAGHWHVTFGGGNPAFVETLWRRERFIFWGLAGALALATAGLRVAAARLGRPLNPAEGPDGALLVHVVVPLIGAFIASGLLSVARFAAAARAGRGGDAARPADWLPSAWHGSLGWWVATLLLSVALSVVALGRPA